MTDNQFYIDKLHKRIEQLEAAQERLWCKACGTVTRDQTCDCNRRCNEMSREPNFVNYADAMQEAAHEQVQRIEQLEAALRAVKNFPYLGGHAAGEITIIDAVLARSSPPKAVDRDVLVKQISAAMADGKDSGGYDTLLDMYAHIALKVIDQSSPPKAST
jgi:hypothetical protein